MEKAGTGIGLGLWASSKPRPWGLLPFDWVRDDGVPLLGALDRLAATPTGEAEA